MKAKCDNVHTLTASSKCNINTKRLYAYPHTNVRTWLYTTDIAPTNAHCAHYLDLINLMWKEPHTHAQHDRCSAAVVCWGVGHPALYCVVFLYIFVVYAHFFSCRPFSLHFLHFHCMCTTPQTYTFVSGTFKLVVAGEGEGDHACTARYLYVMEADSIKHLIQSMQIMH